jgi:hypothetical protein
MVGERAGAEPAGAAATADADDAKVWTATRWRRAASVEYGSRGPWVLTWTISPVARAELAAINASCGQVSRMERSRPITV